MNDVTFARTLQSVLFDNKYDRFVAHRKTGKLNTRSIAKISFSDKLFKRKEERKHKNYSIALVVDCSGSMNSDKAKIAFESAQKLSKHLSSVGINHCVYGFHAVTQPMKPWNTKYDNTIAKKLQTMLRSGYGYWSNDYKFLGYSHDFEKEMKKTHFDYDPDKQERKGDCDNNDPTALRKVAKDMRNQPGIPIMIVLSDGSPVITYGRFQVPEFPKEKFEDPQNRDLQAVVKNIIKSGIEVHSIGILTDSVNNYYPSDRTCAVYDLPQIYDHIIKIIKLHLKRT